MKIQSCAATILEKVNETGKEARQIVSQHVSNFSKKATDCFVKSDNLKDKVNANTLFGIGTCVIVGGLAIKGVQSLINNIKNIKEDKELE